MKAVLTGQVGLDKKEFLHRVLRIAKSQGHDLNIFHVGDMMYSEAPDVAKGKILDLPISRLENLRRSVFKDILAAGKKHANVLVNTHATFRWNHGLFFAFDHDQMSQLDADLYVTVVDSLDVVHEGLEREYVIDHSPKDVLVWREEEILATEVLAQAIRGHGCFFITSRGRSRRNTEILYRLIFEPWRKKVYLSFPTTHVADQPEITAQIDLFREVLAEVLIAFDPGAIEEKYLLVEAAAARDQGRQRLTVQVNGRPVSFAVDELLAVAGDIDGQIYARDFKLIEQADMIVSYIPALAGGQPVLASGVERELQHAFETTKEVYVIWRPKVDPSPFITETASRIFADLAEALSYFQKVGYIGDYQLPLTDGRTGRS